MACLKYLKRGARKGSLHVLLLSTSLRAPWLAKVIWTLVLLGTLAGCADRPTFASAKKLMEVVELQESLSQIIEVKNMHKLESFERDGEFVVEVYFEQHFLLGLGNAAKLTQSTVNMHYSDAQTALSEVQEPPPELIENALAKKYGRFNKGDLRHRYIELVFRKNGGQWLFSERRKHWRDFNISYFPQK